MQEVINNKELSFIPKCWKYIQWKKKIEKQASTGHIHINNICNINIFVRFTVYDHNKISIKHPQKMLHLYKHTSTMYLNTLTVWLSLISLFQFLTWLTKKKKKNVNTLQNNLKVQRKFKKFSSYVANLTWVGLR